MLSAMSPGNPSRPPPELHTQPWTGLHAVCTQPPTHGDTSVLAVTARAHGRPRELSAGLHWGKTTLPAARDPPGAAGGFQVQGQHRDRHLTQGSARLLPARSCDPTSLPATCSRGAGPAACPPRRPSGQPRCPPSAHAVPSPAALCSAELPGGPPPATPASHAPVTPPTARIPVQVHGWVPLLTVSPAATEPGGPAPRPLRTLEGLARPTPSKRSFARDPETRVTHTVAHTSERKNT